MSGKFSKSKAIAARRSGNLLDLYPRGSSEESQKEFREVFQSLRDYPPDLYIKTLGWYFEQIFVEVHCGSDGVRKEIPEWSDYTDLVWARDGFPFNT